MKKLLLLFCAMFISQTQAQSYWQWISSYPDDNIITSGTVAGRHAYFSGTYKALIKTSDGGETFMDISGARNVISTKEDYAQTIAFADSMNGYMIEADGEYITRNGGIYWESAYSYDKSSIVFFSGNVGWKAGNDHFYKTYNKGLSWTFIQNELNDYYTVPVRIFAVDQNRVYVAKLANGGKDGGIYQSNNGGLNFVKLNTGISADSLTQFSCYDIKVDSTGWGCAAGTVFDLKTSRYFGIILKTTDHGRRWSYMLHPGMNLYHVALLNNGAAVISGNTSGYKSTGIILRTTDRGENWKIILDHRLLNHFPLYIPSSGLLMFAGQRVYKSTDQGETFSQCIKYGGLEVNDFVVDDHPTGEDQLVVGTSDNEPGNLLISTDGGWSWDLRVLNREMRFNNIAAVAENVIYLNDQYGTVYKSIDYGLSWSVINRIFSFHEAFSASAGGSLAAIGQFNSVTYYSSDGGYNWSISPIESKYIFNSFKLIKPGIIMGCGKYADSDTTAGFIYRSDNHGDWHIIHFPEEIYRADMVDDKVGYATSFRFIYKTINGGNTWNKVLESEMYYNFSSFIFSTGDYGFVKSREMFLVTMNGGLTWYLSRFNVPFRGSIRKLAYNRNRDIIALGDDGKFCIYKNPYTNNANDHPADSSKASVSIKSFRLQQNYPNPFNPETKISYSLKEAGRVNISIFNALGEQVAVLLDEEMPAGTHEASFHAGHLESGIYFYTLRTGTFAETKKMILLR